MENRWLFVDGDFMIAYLFFRGPEVQQNFWLEIASLAEKFKAERVAIAWDDRRGKRRALHPEYKKGRVDLMEWQAKKPIIKGEIMECASHFPCVMEKMPELEADDLIWIWTRNHKGVIISGDYDLWQCLHDGVEIWMPRQKRLAGPTDIYYEYGGDSLAMVVQRCMIGDRSDNIPGVQGIGEKKAMELWAKHGPKIVQMIVEGIALEHEGDKWLKVVHEHQEELRKNFKLMKFSELISDSEMILGESLLEKEVKFDIESARKYCAWKGWHLIFQKWQPLKIIFQRLCQ